MGQLSPLSHIGTPTDDKGVAVNLEYVKLVGRSNCELRWFTAVVRSNEASEARSIATVASCGNHRFHPLSLLRWSSLHTVGNQIRTAYLFRTWLGVNRRLKVWFRRHVDFNSQKGCLLLCAKDIAIPCAARWAQPQNGEFDRIGWIIFHEISISCHHG